MLLLFSIIFIGNIRWAQSEFTSEKLPFLFGNYNLGATTVERVSVDSAQNILFGGYTYNENSAVDPTKVPYIALYSSISDSLEWFRAVDFELGSQLSCLKFDYSETYVLLALRNPMHVAVLNRDGDVLWWIDQTSYDAYKDSPGTYSLDMDVLGNLLVYTFSELTLGGSGMCHLKWFSSSIRTQSLFSFGECYASSLLYSSTQGRVYLGGSFTINLVFVIDQYLTLNIRNAWDGSELAVFGIEIPDYISVKSLTILDAQVLGNLYAGSVSLYYPNQGLGYCGVFFIDIVSQVNPTVYIYEDLTQDIEVLGAYLYLDGATTKYKQVFKGIRGDGTTTTYLGQYDNLFLNIFKYSEINIDSKMAFNQAHFIDQKLLFLGGSIEFSPSTNTMGGILNIDLDDTSVQNEASQGVPFFPTTALGPWVQGFDIIIGPGPIYSYSFSDIVKLPISIPQPVTTIEDLTIVAPVLAYFSFQGNLGIHNYFSIGDYTFTSPFEDSSLQITILHNGEDVLSQTNDFTVNPYMEDTFLFIEFYTESNDLVVDLTIRAQIIVAGDEATRDESVSFQILTNANCLSSVFGEIQTIDDYSYLIGSQKLEIEFGEFQIFPEECTSIISYFISVGSQLEVPKFLSFDKINRIISVQTNDSGFKGRYQIIIQAFGPPISASVAFLLDIVGNSYFIDAASEEEAIQNEANTYIENNNLVVEIQPGGQTELDLGSIEEQFAERYPVNVEFDFSKVSFAAYDESNKKVIFTPSEEESGTHYVAYSIYPKATPDVVVQKGSIKVIIIENGEEDVVNATNEVNFETISNISTFTPNYSQEGEGTESNLETGTLHGKVRKIHTQGLLEIRFFLDVKTALDLSMLSQDKLEIIRLYGEDDKSEFVRYEAVKIEEKSLTLQLYFEEDLSRTDENDKVQVTFLDRELIYSEDSVFIYKVPQNYTLVARLPPQVSVDDELFQSFVDTFDRIMETMNNVIFSNIGINAVMSSSLQQLWGMFSSFQMITHLPLFAVDIPPHLNVLCYFMIQVAQFSFVDDSLLTESIFTFAEDEYDDEYNYYFGNMGIESRNILLTIGSLIFLLILTLVTTVIGIVLGTLLRRTQRFTKAGNYLLKKFQYSALISYFLEAYLDIFLCALVNLMKMSFEYSGSRAAAYISITLTTLLGAFPFVMLAFLHWNNKKLSEQSFTQKYGVLYEDLELSRSYLLQFYLILRKFSFCILAVLLYDIPALQLLVFLSVCMGISVLYLSRKPFKGVSKNRIEAFNELCLYIVLWIYISFMYYSDHNSAFEMSGLSCLGIIILNFVVNLAVLLTHSIVQLFRLMKTLIKIPKYRRKMNQVQPRSEVFNDFKIEDRGRKLKNEPIIKVSALSMEQGNLFRTSGPWSLKNTSSNLLQPKISQLNLRKNANLIMRREKTQQFELEQP